MEDARPAQDNQVTQRIEIVRKADGSREIPTPVEDLDAAFALIAMLCWRQAS